MMGRHFLGITTGSSKRLRLLICIADADSRRFLGPALDRVDTEPLRSNLVQKEERKVSR